MKLSVILVSLLIFSGSLHAEEKFRAYPVSIASNKILKSLDFNSHPKAIKFKTILSKLKGNKANFSAHYIVATIGCGSNCQGIILIDIITGKIYFPNFTSGLGYDYKLESSLLVVQPESAIKEYYGGEAPKRKLFNTTYYHWNDSTKKMVKVND